MMELFIQKKLNSNSGLMLLDISIEIQKGSFVALFGESGAGKTSILRMLAGLLQPEKGTIRIDDEIWFDEKNRINRKTQKRNVGFLFQDFALFPNMTVRENLSYALEKGQDKNIVDELIEVIDLKDLENQKPENLSGGQKQRVALARTLIRKPKILLLDEPFSSLDAKMKMKLQEYLVKVHQKYSLTTILVSHQISDIINMAQKVFILEKGQIVNEGNPLQVFSNNQISDQFHISGEVAELKKEGENTSITVLVGINFIKFLVKNFEAENLKVGDSVSMSAEASDFKLQKMM